MDTRLSLSALADRLLVSTAPSTAFARTPPTWDIVPLSLSALGQSLVEPLQALGCSETAIEQLQKLLAQSCSRLEMRCQAIYRDTMVQLRTTCSIHDQSVWVAYCKSFGAAVQRQYAEAQKRCFERLFEEVKIARDNQASSFVAYSQPTDIRPGSPCEPTGAFTEEVVGILQEAFQRTATLSAAEVKGLRQITKLSTKQIRTWFANQRQRRGRKPAPYPVATSRRPSNQISPARRNFSDSSTSSSIISYTDSDASSAELPLDRNDVLPSPGDDPFLAFHQQRDRAQATEHLLPPQAYPHALALPSGLRDVHHLPPAPTTAETDRFFSSPPQQASEPIPASASFLDHLASSDPFLDDRFLDNIFGNLGVTANGGLTLTMESFQDEAESGVPMNDFEGGGGSNAGAFSFDW